MTLLLAADFLGKNGRENIIGEKSKIPLKADFSPTSRPAHDAPRIFMYAADGVRGEMGGEEILLYDGGYARPSRPYSLFLPATAATRRTLRFQLDFRRILQLMRLRIRLGRIII